MNTTAGSKGYDITANQAYGSVSAPQHYEEIDNHGDVYTEIEPKEHGAATEGNFQLSECPAHYHILDKRKKQLIEQIYVLVFIAIYTCYQLEHI